MCAAVSSYRVEASGVLRVCELVLLRLVCLGVLLFPPIGLRFVGVAWWLTPHDTRKLHRNVPQSIFFGSGGLFFAFRGKSALDGKEKIVLLWLYLD